MKKISVIVIEDNRLLREGITSLLGKEKDVKVTGAYGDPARAIKRIDEGMPDIVLVDLGLRNLSSLEFVAELKKQYKDIRTIVMDLVPIEEDVLQFVQAGVSGFILKDAGIEDFLRTIRAVAGGEKVLPQHLTKSLFSQIVSKAVNNRKPEKLTQSVRMTRRERQVIDLVAEGLSNKEIANTLNLSTYTIKSHVHNILEKLAIHTRVQIANYVNSIDVQGGEDDSLPEEDAPETGGLEKDVDGED